MASAAAAAAASSSSSSVSWRARCTYKTATVLVCTCNLVAALYVSQLLTVCFFFSSTTPAVGFFQRNSYLPFKVRYTEEQLQRIHEAVEIWKHAEPVDLVKRIQDIRKESAARALTDEQMESLREKVASDLTRRLDKLRAAGSGTQQQHRALERWRKKQLEKIKMREEMAKAKGEKAEAIQETQAAEGLKHLLVAGWSSLLEDIGWVELDAMMGQGENISSDLEIEDGIIPGRTVPSECRAEPHTDYDGAAVRWGLTFHVESAADCCQACLDQAKAAKPGQLKCNIWVYCPLEGGCYSPDIYEHKHQECWLKQTNQPRLNFKGKYAAEYRKSHPTAPVVVPWVSGFISS